MNKPWLSQYPKGVPETVDINQYSSLQHLMEEAFQRYADRPAYECMGKQLSFADIDALSKQLGGYFQSLGFARGDRIAVMMPNVLQYPIALAAIIRAGYIVVNVNPLYTPRELEHQLNDSGAKAIVILENFAHTLAQVIDKTPCRTVIMARMGDLLGGLKGVIVNAVVKYVKKMVPAYSMPGNVKVVPYPAALAAGAATKLSRVELSHNDVAFLQYTGGTTGVSKGAILLHKTLIANLLACEAWMNPGIHKQGRIDQPVFICALPMYHVFSLVSGVLLAMRTGGMNILIPNPRDIPGLIKTLTGRVFHIFPAVNTLFNALANNAEFAKLNFSGLRISVAAVTCNPTDNDAYTGTIGLPLPSVDIKLINDQGAEVPMGERGEIAIRGTTVMAGYWNRPDETAKVMTPDGFFKSGDVGVIDERGYIKIVDRIKDMILVSGFNVYPNEVEGVLVMHPGVLECAVIGVPDKASGEAVKAFAAHRLQEAQVHRVPRRAAQDARGQDPAPRTARRRAQEGRMRRNHGMAAALEQRSAGAAARRRHA